MNTFPTNIQDIDIQILLKIPDEDLPNVCKVNKYVKNICEMEEFWRLKTLNLLEKLPNVAPSSWKSFYHSNKIPKLHIITLNELGLLEFPSYEIIKMQKSYRNSLLKKDQLLSHELLFSEKNNFKQIEDHDMILIPENINSKIIFPGNYCSTRSSHLKNGFVGNMYMVQDLGNYFCFSYLSSIYNSSSRENVLLTNIFSKYYSYLILEYGADYLSNIAKGLNKFTNTHYMEIGFYQMKPPLFIVNGQKTSEFVIIYFNNKAIYIGNLKNNPLNSNQSNIFPTIKLDKNIRDFSKDQKN